LCSLKCIDDVQCDVILQQEALSLEDDCKRIYQSIVEECLGNSTVIAASPSADQPKSLILITIAIIVALPLVIVVYKLLHKKRPAHNLDIADVIL